MLPCWYYYYYTYKQLNIVTYGVVEQWGGVVLVVEEVLRKGLINTDEVCVIYWGI